MCMYINMNKIYLKCAKTYTHTLHARSHKRTCTRIYMNVLLNILFMYNLYYYSLISYAWEHASDI